jgi:hypothetical protein
VVAWTELVFEPDAGAQAALREAWGWQLGESWTPVLFSVIGDVFLALPSKTIWWLSTATGSLEQVAPDRATFAALLRTQRADEWLLPGLVGALQRAGKRLTEGQCYSYLTYPVFAQGSFSVENMDVMSASEHFAFSGALHARLRGRPDGA